MKIPTSKVIAQYALDLLSVDELIERRKAAKGLSTNKLIPLGARRHWAAVVAACDEFLKKQVGE